jgi:hypothetical protein
VGWFSFFFFLIAGNLGLWGGEWSSMVKCFSIMPKALGFDTKLFVFCVFF